MATAKDGALSSPFYSSRVSLSSLQEISRNLHMNVGHALPPNTILLCAVGVGVAIDGTFMVVAWLRRKRTHHGLVCTKDHCNGSVADTDTNGVEGYSDDEVRAQLVGQYCERLCKAILEAPRTPPGAWFRAPPADAPGAYSELPEAVRLLWEDRVRYSLDAREIVGLLCRGPEAYIAASKCGSSAATLALLWRLQLLRNVYESVVVSGDVGRCSAERNELETHSKDLYRSFLCPLQSPMRDALNGCWENLSDESFKLQRRVRELQLRNLWSLAKYVFAGGLDKLFTYSVVGVLTALAARSANAIFAIRMDVERFLPCVVGTTCLATTVSADGGGTVQTPLPIVVVRLLMSEWVLHTVRLGITRVTQDYTSASAAWRRDVVKHRLYYALTRTPLSYFDKTERYNVEELVYYVNDLEGVDVFVHDFFIRLAQSVTSMYVALRLLDMRSGVAVMGTVAAASLLNATVALLRKTYCTLSRHRVTGVESGDSPSDAEEEENRKSTTNNLMFCGADIIEHIPELRPYGADTKLMEWWNNYTAHYRKRSCGLRRVLEMAHSSRYLWALDAVKPVVRWLLPAVVVAFAGGASQTQALLMEAVRATQDVLERVADIRQVVDVVGHNAYKAEVLGRMLDPQNWEDRERVGIDCKHAEACNDLGTVAHTESGVNGTIKDPKREEECVSEKRSLEVVAVRAEGLQFQYPTAPTMDAFLKPASFCIQLRDKMTGAGRLVCITGASGCGKTTLLRLLLGLYTPKTPDALLIQLRSRQGSGPECRAAEEGSDGNGLRWATVDSIARAQLRSELFSYVPQTPVVFPGATIAQNVSLHNRVSLTDESVLAEVRACTNAAGCTHFIKRLPSGMLTPLCVTVGWATPDAVRLSCGQGQRLMLARALFQGCGVLLLDEPTAGLDAETKKLVMKQWRELLTTGRLCGIICVSHDAQVLQMADEVIRL